MNGETFLYGVHHDSEGLAWANIVGVLASASGRR